MAEMIEETISYRPIPNVSVGMFEPGDDVIMHRSWRDHPVIGMGQKLPPKYADRKDQWSHFEIMVDLTGEPYVVRQFNRHEGVPLTLDLRRPFRSIPNLAVQWNWSVKSARAFVSALVAELLITEDLAAAILDRFPRNKRIDRDALPRSTRETVWAKTSGLCVYCGTRLATASGKPNSFHADHVLSVKKGGSDDIANLIPSCATCNSKKGAKTVMEHLLGKDAQ
jgi:hypothetical protein